MIQQPLSRIFQLDSGQRRTLLLIALTVTITAAPNARADSLNDIFRHSQAFGSAYSRELSDVLNLRRPAALRAIPGTTNKTAMVRINQEIRNVCRGAALNRTGLPSVVHAGTRHIRILSISRLSPSSLTAHQQNASNLLARIDAKYLEISNRPSTPVRRTRLAKLREARRLVNQKLNSNVARRSRICSLALAK